MKRMYLFTTEHLIYIEESFALTFEILSSPSRSYIRKAKWSFSCLEDKVRNYEVLEISPLNLIIKFLKILS